MLNYLKLRDAQLFILPTFSKLLDSIKKNNNSMTMSIYLFTLIVIDLQKKKKNMLETTLVIKQKLSETTR